VTNLSPTGGRATVDGKLGPTGPGVKANPMLARRGIWPTYIVLKAQ